MPHAVEIAGVEERDAALEGRINGGILTVSSAGLHTGHPMQPSAIGKTAGPVVPRRRLAVMPALQLVQHVKQRDADDCIEGGQRQCAPSRRSLLAQEGTRHYPIQELVKDVKKKPAGGSSRVRHPGVPTERNIPPVFTMPNAQGFLEESCAGRRARRCDPLTWLRRMM